MDPVVGYSEFTKQLDEGLKSGVIADTNLLIAATYDLDSANSDAIQFLDILSEHRVPIFCNVNVRSEFLEIHRRIIFTEALLDFESHVNKAKIPIELVKKLNSIRTRSSKQTLRDRALRLSEAEIKDFKVFMSGIRSGNGDLWATFCEDRVGGKLTSVWSEAEGELGLNFLSLRKEDQAIYFNKSPEWEVAVRLMESEGLSSSDAMIVNLFLCSKLKAIATSDWDVASAVKKAAQNGKTAFCPDEIAKRFRWSTIPMENKRET